MACEKVAGGECSCVRCECEGCECKTSNLNSDLNTSVDAIASGIEGKCCVSEGIKKELSPEIEAKLDTLLSIGEECITRDELAALLEKKPEFIAYDGFEPSGRMHIAQVNY